MLRHTAFFMLKEGNGPEEMQWMQKGSAYMRFTAAGPVAIDFGSDLFGGSLHLSETKPWDRTPRWRAATEGPPCDYDVALHLDFEDEAGLAGLQQGRRAPRDRRLQRRGLSGRAHREDRLVVRGRAADDAGTRPALRDVHLEGRLDEASKERALTEVKRLGDEAGVERLTLGTGVGDAEDRLRLDPRPRAAGRRRGRDARSRATRTATTMRTLSAATKYEWTARMTHAMHGH